MATVIHVTGCAHNNRGVIREPMAALLAYQQEQQQQQAQQQENGKKKIMVVFDLGHVHLDVGVVEEDAQVTFVCLKCVVRVVCLSNL